MSVMNPLMRFSAVRGTSSPVNGFCPRITVSRWKPGTLCAFSLSQPSSAFLISSRIFRTSVGLELGDAQDEAERALRERGEVRQQVGQVLRLDRRPRVARTALRAR